MTIYFRVATLPPLLYLLSARSKMDLQVKKGTLALSRWNASKNHESRGRCRQEVPQSTDIMPLWKAHPEYWAEARAGTVTKWGIPQGIRHWGEEVGREKKKHVFVVQCPLFHMQWQHCFFIESSTLWWYAQSPEQKYMTIFIIRFKSKSSQERGKDLPDVSKMEGGS